MSAPQLVLYGTEMSAPVRAVLLTLKALNLPYEFREVNLLAREHLTPEYVSKNPQHSVPTLEDAGKYMWDSHAICAYLVRKYGKDDDGNDGLYPKDHYRRAVVDQRLHYETGVVFQACLQIVRPLFFGGATEIPKDKLETVHEVYAMLETFLGGDKNSAFMAGDGLTIADFSIVSTVSCLTVAAIAPLDAGRYPKLTGWLERMLALPYYAEACAEGVRTFGESVRNKLPKKLWQKAVADIKSSKQ